MTLRRHRSMAWAPSPLTACARAALDRIRLAAPGRVTFRGRIVDKL